jgi:aspartate-semialdehyde dehydrogenase
MPTIEVAVLGATGKVGEEYLKMLKHHPWFRVVEVTGNSKIGAKLGEVVPNLPSSMSSIEVKESDPSKIESNLVFSPLPTSVAKEVESNFAKAGFGVVTDASPHRMDEDVPLMIPEVNPDHLRLLPQSQLGKRGRRNEKGFIVATPNCTTIGLAMTLKPLHDTFGVKKVVMTSFQALSGAGYPGVPSLDIQDNVIPFIEGEEEKVANEANKLLGTLSEDEKKIKPSSIEIYCSCNRVAVIDGHLESVYLESSEKILDPEKVFGTFKGEPQELKLPSAPQKPILVTREKNRPQPRLDRMAGEGMSTVVGRIRHGENSRTLQYHLLTHNTIRGAAGGALLTAELLCKQLDLF